MRSTFSILYYINRGKVKTDGTTAIMCRITIDGKSSVFTTGYYCNPECWNTKNETVKDGRTNGLLADLRARLETSYMNLLKETGIITAEMLKNEITCVGTVPMTLLKSWRRRTRKVENPFRSDKFYLILPSVQVYSGIPARIPAFYGDE